MKSCEDCTEKLLGCWVACEALSKRMDKVDRDIKRQEREQRMKKAA